MTTPTNSNRLREIEEFYATDVEAAKEWHSFPPTKEGDVAFLLCELDKLRAEKAETIEVLELVAWKMDAFPYEALSSGSMPRIRNWWRGYGKPGTELLKPLLDKLKGES